MLRLGREDAAKEAMELIPDGKLKLDDDFSCQLEIVDGEEEEKYLENVKVQRQRKRKMPFRGRGGGRGGKMRRR